MRSMVKYRGQREFKQRLWRWLSVVTVVTVGTWSASSRLAHADAGEPLQPLNQFLKAAKKYAVDNREVVAQAAQQTADANVILGHSLPSFNAKGTYTRNEYQAAIPAAAASAFLGTTSGPLYLQRYDQLDAALTVSMPVIDVGNWVRANAAGVAADALSKGIANQELMVQNQVARTYYQLVATRAVVRASEVSLAAAEDSLRLAQARRAGGIASELDVDRAVAQVESNKQGVANAVLGVELASRSLQTLAGMHAGTSEVTLIDDLHEEPPLEQWEQAVDNHKVPGLESAAQNAKAARLNAVGTKLTYLPTVSVSAQEHFSNITSFTGQSTFYLVSLVASWTLDFSTVYNTVEQDASASIAKIHEDRTRLAAADAIHQAWYQVATQIAVSRASVAQEKATAHAAVVARDRYASGTATQLDLTQAERDAYSAAVSRIQAQADLAYARAALRLNAGQSLEDAP